MGIVASTDNRSLQMIEVGDFMRPSLWKSHSNNQVHMTSMLTKVLGVGPALVAAAEIPDLDAFCIRGGKDVLPLWKDAGGISPKHEPWNLDALSSRLGTEVGPIQLFQYCHGLLATPAFTARFLGRTDDSWTARSHHD
jgi:hypothetical protein